MNIIIRSIAVLMCTLAVPVMAQQNYPTRPIRIIVPFLPGGTTDILARLLGARFHAAWGQTTVVENRPGAGGNIGADVVAKSAPDGYTLVMTTASATVNVTLYPKMPYDLRKDLAPITLVASAPIVIVAPDSAGRLDQTGAKAAFSAPSSIMTPTTANPPAADLCTRCSSAAACLPPIVCSLGAWKWNCANAYVTPSNWIELPGVQFTWIVCPLFTTSMALGW